MPPRLHLVRHAQGYHNLGPEHWGIVDPLLTDKGKHQCFELRQNFPYTSQVELVVTSPLRRAIYTGLESFKSVFEQEQAQKLIALADLQELSDFPCDVGSSVADLQREFNEAHLPVDVSFVEEDWTDKTGRYESTVEKIRARASDARRWLKARPENDIVVVSHGGFLHFLTDDWEDAWQHEATGWDNTEFRTYEFIQHDQEGDDNPMQETAESRRRRGVHNSPPTQAQQKDLSGQMIRIWAEQGYAIGSFRESGGTEEILVK